MQRPSQAIMQENDLLENHALLRMIVASLMSCAMFVMDEHGCITLWGDGAERIFGYSSQDAVQSAARCCIAGDSLCGADAVCVVRLRKSFDALCVSHARIVSASKRAGSSTVKVAPSPSPPL